MNNKQLQHLWQQSGYANITSFNKFVKSKTSKFSYKDIKKFYDEQRTQQLHKPYKRDRSKYKPIVTFKSCFDWQADLLDMSKYYKHNRGYKWILIAVDVFTRKAYCRALKNKTTGETARGFSEILNESGCSPASLTNHRVAEVGFHRTLGVIDRFSRTIKTILSKMFK